MTTVSVGDAELFYEEAGSGPSLVLVHGSWADHSGWAAVVPLLAATYRVVTYDRRGHSQSSQPPGQGSINEDVEDLAGLIRLLNLQPALVAGNSFGALITLRLAGAHPDLLRGLAVHEPPGLGLLAGDAEYAPMLQGFGERAAAVATLLEQEQNAEAAELFVETIALGPGSWTQLPAEQQATFIRNAQTFFDEMREPDALDLDLQQLHTYAGPVLLTQGDQSPPMFAPVLDRIQAVLPQSERQTYLGAGHVPHMTHPEDYANTLTGYAVAAEGQR